MFPQWLGPGDVPVAACERSSPPFSRDTPGLGSGSVLPVRHLKCLSNTHERLNALSPVCLSHSPKRSQRSAGSMAGAREQRPHCRRDGACAWAGVFCVLALLRIGAAPRGVGDGARPAPRARSASPRCARMPAARPRIGQVQRSGHLPRHSSPPQAPPKIPDHIRTRQTPGRRLCRGAASATPCGPLLSPPHPAARSPPALVGRPTRRGALVPYSLAAASPTA